MKEVRSRTGSDAGERRTAQAETGRAPRSRAPSSGSGSVHDRVSLGGRAPEYIASIWTEKSSRMTLRLMLSFGVR